MKGKNNNQRAMRFCGPFYFVCNDLDHLKNIMYPIIWLHFSCYFSSKNIQSFPFRQSRYLLLNRKPILIKLNVSHYSYRVEIKRVRGNYEAYFTVKIFPRYSFIFWFCLRTSNNIVIFSFTDIRHNKTL